MNSFLIFLFQICNSTLSVWCDESEVQYSCKPPFFSLSIVNAVKTIFHAYWQAVCIDRMYFMCTQRHIKVMGGTTQKMLFSSGPNVDQAIIFFTRCTLQSNSRCSAALWSGTRSFGRYNVNDTNAPPDICIAMKLNNVDRKEGYHPLPSIIMLIKFLGLLGD